MINRYEIQTWLKTGMRQTPKSNTLAALARRVSSNLLEGQSERLAWLGGVAPMKSHSGEIQPGKPHETSYAIRNDKFVSAVAVPGGWIRTDRTGDAQTRIAQLAGRYVQWPGKLVALLIEAGFTVPGYDGVNFFSTNHVIGKGSFSNLIDVDVATPATPTADEFAKVVGKAIGAMWGMPDDQGEPFNEGMTEVTIVCHSDLADVATAALNAPNLDTGTGVRTNSLQYVDVKRNLIASPRFTGLKAANRICVFRTDAEATPFLLQENLGEHRTEILDQNSDHYKKSDEIVASVTAVGNAGYGNPQDALAVNLV